MAPTDRPSQSGFSLVETVAALGILALAALPLMQTATTAANGSRQLEDRMLARTVAENILSFELVRPDIQPAGTRSGLSGQMGRSFSWTLVTGPARAGELQPLSVSVSREGSAYVIAQLDTMRAIPMAPAPSELDTEPVE